MSASPLRKTIEIPPSEYLGPPRYERPLPEDQRGHCLVCGAGFIEHIACQSGDCHFVRHVEEGPA